MKSTHSITVLSVATYVIVLLIYMRNYSGFNNMFEKSKKIPIAQSVIGVPASSEQCNVLADMTIGHWKTRPLTQEENNHMYRFLKRARHDFKFPPNYQRSDGLCGNVSTLEPGLNKSDQGIFRAVCDPEGATPCCFNYRCVYKYVEECTCENCIDIRNMKHAEYSSWIPSNPACVYDTYSPQRACQILKGLNIAFVGDSLIRNFYIALLLITTGNMKDGAVRDDVTKGVRKNCSDWHIFIGKTCRFYVDSHVKLCDGNVNITGYFYYVRYFWKLLEKSMPWSKTSFILTGDGPHSSYNETVVQNSFVNLFVETIKKLKSKPHVLWAAPHSPGILKSPTYTHQTYEKVKRFNAKMKPYLESVDIPVLDTFSMTDGMMSIDGQHYGIGMNLVKANILLKYIEDARKQQGW